MPRVARRKPLDANIGVVSVGLDTYWRKFVRDYFVRRSVFLL